MTTEHQDLASRALLVNLSTSANLKRKGKAVYMPVANTARSAHYDMTLPWIKGGHRLLPIAGYDRYRDRMSEFRSQWDDAVSEHPGEGSRFTFEVDYAPLPLPENLNARGMATSALTEIRTGMNERTDRRIEAARRDIANRIFLNAERLHGKLTPETRTCVQDTLLDGIRDNLQRIRILNVMGDDGIESARARFLAMIDGVDVESIRINRDNYDPTIAAGLTLGTKDIMYAMSEYLGGEDQ